MNRGKLLLVSLRRRLAGRRGATLVLATILLVVLMGMLAFSIDVGYVANVQTELKRAVDAGALAGAGALAHGEDAARQQVYEFLRANRVGNREIELDDVTVQLGHWDPHTRSFAPASELPSAVRVVVRHAKQPLFFGRVLGKQDFTVTEEAIAMYQPRDIVLVLDYSASMNDDSQLSAESRFGAAAIDAGLRQIYAELGSPVYGKMQWIQSLPSGDSVSKIRKTLGLDNVRYPYPSGSWDDYINYVKMSISPSSYRHRYGYKTLINYWLNSKPLYRETPDLWKVSAQPITALKNAVTVFLAFLREVDTDDRLGLAVYTAADGTALLEHELTGDYDAIEQISRHRQAGHYDHYTNIGAGLKTGLDEILEHGRPGAFKMIVLMTDGLANRPQNTTQGKLYALAQANACAAARIPVVTISLGTEADTSLMQQIADMTGGVHFRVPTNKPVAEYEEDLKDVFRQIANDRPLKLVK
jgi:hypothetical protein